MKLLTNQFSITVLAIGLFNSVFASSDNAAQNAAKIPRFPLNFNGDIKPTTSSDAIDYPVISSTSSTAYNQYKTTPKSSSSYPTTKPTSTTSPRVSSSSTSKYSTTPYSCVPVTVTAPATQTVTKSSVSTVTVYASGSPNSSGPTITNKDATNTKPNGNVSTQNNQGFLATLKSKAFGLASKAFGFLKAKLSGGAKQMVSKGKETVSANGGTWLQKGMNLGKRLATAAYNKVKDNRSQIFNTLKTRVITPGWNALKNQISKRMNKK